jgi:parallel beta-helix repeat protein
LYGRGTVNNKIKYNHVGTNQNVTSYIPNKIGIHLFFSSGRNYITDNTILGNDDIGIKIEKDCHQNIIASNYIGTNKTGQQKLGNKFGIGLIKSSKNSIVKNKIWYNETGISEETSQNIIVGNDIAYCSGNTGIHMFNSFSLIDGNDISHDETDGIKTENGSNPLITNNNILDNEGFGVVNTDENILLKVDGNYWGETSGIDQFLDGNINAESWLEDPASFYLSLTKDTLFINPDSTDSLQIYCSNKENETDIIDIVVGGDKNHWLNEHYFQYHLSDTTISAIQVNISPTEMIPEEEVVKFYVQATSQGDSELSMVDSFFVSLYDSYLNEIMVSPDTVDCYPGDSVNFSARGFDQKNHSMSVNVIWSGQGGEIDSSGKFIAGEDFGSYVITALDTLTSITGFAYVAVVDSNDTTVAVDENNFNENVEVPKEYSLSQNYPNPFNPTTTIAYSLPFSSNVKIEIYNLLGQRVESLKNEIQPTGYYKINWNANNYATGIYLLKMQAISMDNSEIFTVVKKMVLLK